MWSALYQITVLSPVNAFVSYKAGGQIFEFLKVHSRPAFSLIPILWTVWIWLMGKHLSSLLP